MCYIHNFGFVTLIHWLLKFLFVHDTGLLLRLSLARCLRQLMKFPQWMHEQSCIFRKCVITCYKLVYTHIHYICSWMCLGFSLWMYCITLNSFSSNRFSYCNSCLSTVALVDSIWASTLCLWIHTLIYVCFTQYPISPPSLLPILISISRHKSGNMSVLWEITVTTKEN